MATESTLINIAEFRQSFVDLLNVNTTNEAMELVPVDIAPDCVQKPPLFEQIDAAIRREVANRPKPALQTGHPANTLTSQMYSEGNLPQLSDLMAASTVLACLKEKEEIKQNTSRREVNYVTTFMQEQQQSVSTEVTPLAAHEVIITVAFHHPHKGVKVQEHIVLGSQPLTALIDVLYCLSNDILEGEKMHSSFLFIENTFYNDRRDANSMDYSENIINWANQNRRYTQPELGIFSTRDAATTTFDQLSVRLNHKYVYVHQGECEHFFTFKDVRLVNSNDNQNYNVYPIHTFQAKIRRKKCRICDIYPAKYVTYHDKLAPESPCFFCEQCYRPLHYSFDGNLLYNDYTVYEYYHE